MAINFPDSPTIGDEYTANGFVWTWTGAAWEKVGAASSAANDFALLVGTSGDTTYVLDRAYAVGRYNIDFVNDDTTYDIYFVAEDGTYAGYTNGAIAEVSAAFEEVVVLGAANNETILFTYQGTLTSPSSTGDVAVAGAFINSVVTSSLPNIDDTTVVNGGNFAADVAVSFIGQDTTEISAKAVVRSSSTQLVVTRPDSFSPDNSPYTVKVVNPGIPVPASTNAHLLSNSVTAGTNPAWVTSTDIFYSIDSATSITLLATDTEGSNVDYSLVLGTLPAGLTLDGPTGVISGTFTGTATEGDITAITVRATDAGGNFLDKAFNLTANAVPTWITPTGALDPAPDLESAYSYQLEASGGTVGGALTYTLVSGALLTGHTLSSTGLISGTSTDPVDTVANFTIRVTDQAGLFADREFSATVVFNPRGQIAYTIPGTYTFTVPDGVSSICAVAVGAGGSGAVGNAGGGGGGGALAWVNNISVTPGSTLDIVVGGGDRRVTSWEIFATESPPYDGIDGGDSYIDYTGGLRIVHAGGGQGGKYSLGAGGLGGQVIIGQGGNGGNGGSDQYNAGDPGGGGAGGYSGNGGNGSSALPGSSVNTPSSVSTPGNGAGGGGGGGGFKSVYTPVGGCNGGGVGIFGEGPNGAGGANVTLSSSNELYFATGYGYGGSGGGRAVVTASSGYNYTTISGQQIYYAAGANFGGGGGGSNNNGPGGEGGGGAVRIIWGAGRAFPSTNTADV